VHAVGLHSFAEYRVGLSTPSSAWARHEIVMRHVRTH
jgi:hypothetical protein